MKLQGKDIYLDTLKEGDCRKLWNDFEYDFAHPAEELNIGQSDTKAAGWFEEIQKLQGDRNVRLGIFLNSGAVIGDVALQDIDRANRSCNVGMGMARIDNRGKGYGSQAILLMLWYGFRCLGMERIAANTLDVNIGAQKALEKCGFTLEGRERKAIYFNAEMHDRMHYSILREEYAIREIICPGRN